MLFKTYIGSAGALRNPGGRVPSVALAREGAHSAQDPRRFGGGPEQVLKLLQGRGNPCGGLELATGVYTLYAPNAGAAPRPKEPRGKRKKNPRKHAPESFIY